MLSGFELDDGLRDGISGTFFSKRQFEYVRRVFFLFRADVEYERWRDGLHGQDT